MSNQANNGMATIRKTMRMRADTCEYQITSGARALWGVLKPWHAPEREAKGKAPADGYRI